MTDSAPIIYSKTEFIDKLKEIAARGWVLNARKGNSGGIGNTLEDLLGITENNLPIPNSGEWELKTQRLSTSSLITLFHMEPSPRALHFVPSILLPKYGWSLQSDSSHYSQEELSFRQTMTTTTPTSRGFKVLVDDCQKKIQISFDSSAVSEEHAD